MVEGEAMKVTIEGYEPGTFTTITFDPAAIKKIGACLTTIDADGTKKTWVVVETRHGADNVTVGVVGEENEWFQMLKGR
jgi:hypothetical protein